MFKHLSLSATKKTEAITLGRSFVSRKINRLFLKRASKNTSSIDCSERFRRDFEDSDRYQSAVSSDFEDSDRFWDLERFRSSVATVICTGKGSMLHRSSLWMKSTALDLLEWNLDLVMVIVKCRGRCWSFSINWMDLSI
ncbi:unnamed protein product [Camellia sinensis]